MNLPIRVVIADDHPPIRAGIRALLELASDVEVVAEVATSADAIEVCADLQPDVITMDLRMPGVGGVGATRAIVTQNPHVGVLVVTMVEDDDAIFAALQAGARGYLSKESGPTELHRAVHAVANGEFITSASIARRVAQFFATGSASRASEAFPALTRRELEVLDLVAQGENNTGIARRLYVSPKTVRNHIASIFAKLHFADRAEAIVQAREAGMGRRSSLAQDSSTAR